MDEYKCSECGWQYDWTMGDRVKAVKRHELAHLLECRVNGEEDRDDEIPAYRLAEYIEQRLRTAQLL